MGAAVGLYSDEADLLPNKSCFGVRAPHTYATEATHVVFRRRCGACTFCGAKWWKQQQHQQRQRRRGELGARPDSPRDGGSAARTGRHARDAQVAVRRAQRISVSCLSHHSYLVNPFVFRRSSAVSRDGLMESCPCRQSGPLNMVDPPPQPRTPSTPLPPTSTPDPLPDLILSRDLCSVPQLYSCQVNDVYVHCAPVINKHSQLKANPILVVSNSYYFSLGLLQKMSFFSETILVWAVASCRKNRKAFFGMTVKIVKCQSLPNRCTTPPK